MKKFTVNCDFNGSSSPFTIYVGDPEREHHPLHFQSEWLGKTRGGAIPGEVMEALSNIQSLAIKNNVSFEELCVYALGSLEEEEDSAAEEDDADVEGEEEA